MIWSTKYNVKQGFLSPPPPHLKDTRTSRQKLDDSENKIQCEAGVTPHTSFRIHSNITPQSRRFQSHRTRWSMCPPPTQNLESTLTSHHELDDSNNKLQGEAQVTPTPPYLKDTPTSPHLWDYSDHKLPGKSGIPPPPPHLEYTPTSHHKLDDSKHNHNVQGEAGVTPIDSDNSEKKKNAKIVTDIVDLFYHHFLTTYMLFMSTIIFLKERTR